MNKTSVFIVSLLFMIIIEGCRYKHTSYSDFRSLGNQGWPATEPLEYVLKGVDSLAMPADIVYVTIRHNNDYRYCNLWLFVDYVYSDTVTTDTVECMLSDKFGKWYGSGFGASYERVVFACEASRLRDLRKIVGWNGMRDDTLRGISDVGLSLGVYNAGR